MGSDGILKYNLKFPWRYKKKVPLRDFSAFSRVSDRPLKSKIALSTMLASLLILVFTYEIQVCTKEIHKNLIDTASYAYTAYEIKLGTNRQLEIIIILNLMSQAPQKFFKINTPKNFFLTIAIWYIVIRVQNNILAL